MNGYKCQIIVWKPYLSYFYPCFHLENPQFGRYIRVLIKLSDRFRRTIGKGKLINSILWFCFKHLAVQLVLTMMISFDEQNESYDCKTFQTFSLCFLSKTYKTFVRYVQKSQFSIENYAEINSQPNATFNIRFYSRATTAKRKWQISHFDF